MKTMIVRGDAEVEVDVDYKVHSYGYPARRGKYPEDDDPGEGPEFEITGVWYLDEDGDRTISALKDITEKEMNWIEAEVLEAINESASSRDDDYDTSAEDPPDYDVCDRLWDPYDKY